MMNKKPPECEVFYIQYRLNKCSVKGVLMMKGLFLRSIENKEIISIIYIDSKNQVTQRIVRVISMNDDSTVAICYWRKQVRTFKLENILSTGPIRNRLESKKRA